MWNIRWCECGQISFHVATARSNISQFPKEIISHSAGAEYFTWKTTNLWYNNGKKAVLLWQTQSFVTYPQILRLKLSKCVTVSKDIKIMQIGVYLGSIYVPHPPPEKSSFVRTGFFQWCLPVTQMMTATPNDVRFANDACLRAHRGKHRIIAKRSEATSYLRSKCIISPWGDASFKNAYALIYLRKCDIIFKECSETEGWFKLLFNTYIIDEETFKNDRNLCGRIRRMLIASCTKLKINT